MVNSSIILNYSEVQRNKIINHIHSLIRSTYTPYNEIIPSRFEGHISPTPVSSIQYTSSVFAKWSRLWIHFTEFANEFHKWHADTVKEFVAHDVLMFWNDKHCWLLSCAFHTYKRQRRTFLLYRLYCSSLYTRWMDPKSQMSERNICLKGRLTNTTITLKKKKKSTA